MEFLSSYGAKGQGGDAATPKKTAGSGGLLEAAPRVNVSRAPTSQALVSEKAQTQHMYAPELGPQKPYSARSVADSSVEHVYVDAATHAAQFELYESKGYAFSLKGKGVLGDVRRALVDRGEESGPKKKRRVREREDAGDAATDSFRGPWAAYVDEAEKRAREEKEREEEEAQLPDAPEVVEEEEARADAAEPRPAPTAAAGGAYSELCIADQGPDYLGRTYVSAPAGLKPAALQNFIPKKRFHQFKGGHTKPVTATRFFPDTGHLLLTASHDTQLILWEMHGHKRKLRVGRGHTKGIKDACWRNGGSGYVSAGLEGNTFLWDTETGQCSTTLNNGTMPYCLAVHDSHPNSVLVGTRGKVIYQWDTRTGQVAHEYDRHLGPVNAMSFFDGGRRFLSSSDDKSIRYWEFGIGIEIKIHSEPHLHSAPVIAPHPGNEWVAVQSMDNQVLLYGVAVGAYKANNRKRFIGHMTAGYACGLAFSPDGSILCSGDTEGKLVFWDYRTSRINNRIQRAHKGAVISVAWHPRESSTLVSGGWDGSVVAWK